MSRKKKILRSIFKEITALLFIVCIICSSTNMAFADENSNQTSEELGLMTYEEYQNAMEDDDQIVPMQDSSKHSNSSNDPVKIDKPLPLTNENLDFNNAEENIIRIDENGDPLLVDPLTAPESNVRPVILNPETCKDGQITTDTQIAWLVEFSDADGDTLLDYSIGGFPLRYLVGNALYENGFITHFSDPGSYTVLYRAIDSNGEAGQVQRLSLNVIPVENYQVIEDSLNSANDRKTYTVDIDFTEIDAATFVLIKSSDSQARMTVRDEAGELMDMEFSALTKRWGYVEKPESGGVHTYTITIFCNSDKDYVSGSSGFRVLYGDKKDTEAMLSGPENAAYIEKFTNVKDNAILTGYTPNKDEDWYRFTADGPTVITLLTYYPDLRFQICDTTNLMVMFDSNREENSSIHKTKFTASYPAAEKARINTAEGQDYYLVLYSRSQISTAFMVEKTVNIAVGLPHMAPQQTEWYFGNRITADSSSYSSVSYVNVGDNGNTVPRTALVDKVQWAGAKMSDIKNFRVKEPGGSSWRNSRAHDLAMYFDYVKDSDSNINANGTWQLGFRASLQSVTFIPEFKVYYQYELGD